jgi:histidine kinase
MINLLANALRYTPSGGCVTISAEAHDFFVQIGVRDTGIGIAAEHLPHIFERFYRVDKSRARDVEGSGLGLAIAREIAREHGGELGHSGHPGATVFSLRLPIAE